MTISANFSTTQPSLLLDFANTATLDPRVTFSRSTPAVYYDKNTNAIAEQNTYIQSNNFATSWILTNIATPAQGATDPFGGASAWTLDEGTATGTHNIYQGMVMQNQVSYTYTLSVYAQNVTGQYVQLSFYSAIAGSAASAIFDLSTGTVANSAGGYPVTGTTCVLVPSTTWYRCSLSATIPVAAYIGGFSARIAMTNATTLPSTLGYLNSYTGTSRTINIYGAQFEQHPFVGLYTPTTTTTVTNTIPQLLSAAINVPRFDYDPITRQALGLVTELQSPNLFTYSSDFSNAAWTKTALNLTPNIIVAPDGTLTGSKISSSSGTWTSGLISTGSLSVASSSISVYAKAAEAPIIQIATYNYGNFQCYFDLTTGVSNGTAGFTRTMTDVGNGWWRCTVSGTLTAGGNFIFIPMAVNSGLNPAPIGQGIYIWGAQLENSTFTSSYISTTTAAAVRTRDNAFITGTNFTSWYSQVQGTLYAEAALNATTGNTNYCAAVIDNTAQTAPYTRVINVSGSLAANINYKGAVTYSQSGTGLSYFNGVSSASGGSATVQLPATQLAIGIWISIYAWTYRVKKIAYYPVALTATQLSALTGS
jgi:hypothetical protein